MFETLFGSEMPLPARFFIAFVIVLVLIGLTAWLVRRFAANRLGGAAARGRQPRLAVIDAATVDGRRRLVLIRRDNVEHLLMIGGPSDVVIEPNIVRAAASRVATGIEPAPRQAEGGWPLQPASEPAPAPAPTPRSYRSTATEEPWHPPEPGARPRPADVAAVAEVAPRAPEPVIARSESPRMSIAPSAPEPVAAPPQTDHNLAEMALQLEAALRRTAAPEGRPPVTDALAAAPVKPAPTRDFKPRIEPKLEPKFDDKPEGKIEPLFEPKFEFKPEPKLEPKLESKPADEKPTPGKSLYDNLEEEMASLLGRPTGKT